MTRLCLTPAVTESGIDFDDHAYHRAEMSKNPKKISRKPKGVMVSAKTREPEAKSASAMSLSGGFARISETRIRKVY